MSHLKLFFILILHLQLFFIVLLQFQLFIIVLLQHQLFFIVMSQMWCQNVISVQFETIDYDVTIAEIRKSIFEFWEAISQAPTGISENFLLFQVREVRMHVRHEIEFRVARSNFERQLPDMETMQDDSVIRFVNVTSQLVYDANLKSIGWKKKISKKSSLVSMVFEEA